MKAYPSGPQVYRKGCTSSIFIGAVSYNNGQSDISVYWRTRHNAFDHYCLHFEPSISSCNYFPLFVVIKVPC